MHASVASELWGEIALSRLKLGARLMMRGKGDTYQKRKGACVKLQRVIARGENRALLHTQKEALTRGKSQACERSERALGEIALSRLKLGARLMMRGKGDTYQKRKGACVKVQRVIARGENRALLHTQREALTRGKSQACERSERALGEIALIVA